MFIENVLGIAKVAGFSTYKDSCDYSLRMNTAWLQQLWMPRNTAASLQTFNDCYEFFGYDKYTALQIGNAVPVRLAEVIAAHIRRIRMGCES